jgi:hypothetical protein
MMDGALGKLAAVCVGAVFCLVALTAWQPPTDGSPPGLDLRLIAIPPGELTVEPTGVVASARAMQAGGPAVHGELLVRNIAGRPLSVRVAALPSDRELARKVRLRAPGLRLPAHGSDRIDVSAWLPPGASGYRGGILDVTLDVRARPVGSGG